MNKLHCSFSTAAKIIYFFLFVVCYSAITYADPSQLYLEKFLKYHQWNQNLPKSPDNEFLNFINDTSPLSQKLREKWLYQLALNKDWITFKQYYKPSNDISLQCYDVIADYQLGHRQDALKSAYELWLTGDSQPPSCDNLFTMLLKTKEIDEKLITKRLALALDNRNLKLAFHLLRQYSPAHLNDIKILNNVHQKPSRITLLSSGGLNSHFYLYGLNRMIPIHMEQAIRIWQATKTKSILSYTQQQDFLVHLVLFKSMRNYTDAPAWFAKINPQFYTEPLIGAQIRYALKFENWSEVERLIALSNEKDTPCWQYWLARAIEVRGPKEKAIEIYQSLAQSRNYYGFLASLRLKKEFHFENEQTISNTKKLNTYRPITEQIKALYLSKQIIQASRLLNDFFSELPKDDKSALAYWLDQDLQWHGKAVYLSNSNELGNQLSLRFPLAYRDTIVNYARHYQISKELIYAIIRQESAFRDDAVSSAGAEGLMQIMPSTARVVSRSERIAYSNPKQLFSSQKNINIGVAYLKQLAQRFNKHPILMAAAYNAGPKQVVYWLKTHPPKEMDIWIETLPWVETRNYLKNIIAFYAVYQFRMREKPDLTPFMDNSFNIL